ncbi:hypothetical protein QEZ54_34035 [Catellatospora sp. KI3]|uniref:hypothetical protein n=1 Tax=Catellatospora sp. KI3 TaxID=3041620 RepID=UPI002482CA50|nr:hypothetical protein [Catellatospora sp. KI3]MDI1466008.1 hypothetical protein [Catellatospora sp. KI3]
MTATLPDDVWNRLDPAAGALPRRTRLRLAVTGFALLGALGVGAGLWFAGAIVPRLEATPGFDAQYVRPDGTLEQPFGRFAPPSRRMRHTLYLHNGGSDPVELTGIGADAPGLRVVRVALGDTHLTGNRWSTGGAEFKPGDTYQLRPDEQLTVELDYDVTDCDLVSAGQPGVPVRLRRFFGEQTVLVYPPNVVIEPGGWHATEFPDPRAVGWQRYLAEAACGRLPKA